MVEDSDNSFESASVLSTPRVYVNPRSPIMRSSQLSTKRERAKMTPQFRRPAPKVARTAPPTKSVYSSMQCTFPRIITNTGATEPLSSPIYLKEKQLTYFEQCFKIISLIGKGSFGEVFSVQSLEDSRYYAVKVSIQLIRQNCASKYREVESHMRLPKHSNLVEFVRAWEEKGRLYIQQELCHKSLLQHCMEKHALPEPEIWNIFIDLLRAVDHLHSNDMIHDDIKPDNIFLTKEGICKLGDFGLVINLQNPKDVDSAEEGDSKYLAPEVLNGSPSKASDIFSLGVTILEAATDLDIPSNGESWHQIRNGQIPDRFFSGISKELRFLIEWMLSSNPLIRPTAKEMLNNPCIRSKLIRRKCYIKSIELCKGLSNWSFVVLTWVIALCSFALSPIMHAFSAICNRRRSICALSISKTQTPLQTPETSKVFNRTMTTPFDFSDDENLSIKRRLFPPIPKWRMEYDQDQDDDEVPTSSSNSSTIESHSSPPVIRKTLNDESPKRRTASTLHLRQFRTPQCARRLLTSSVRKHAGNGDFEDLPTVSRMRSEVDTESGEEDVRPIETDWETEKKNKYVRMMRAEESIDSDDADALIVESTKNLRKAAFIPQSCPSLRSCRRLNAPRAPKLDFTLLDGDNDNVEVIKKPAKYIRGLAGRMVRDHDSSADDF